VLLRHPKTGRCSALRLLLLLVPMMALAACRRPETPRETEVPILGATAHFRFRLDDARGAGVSRQKLLVVLQGQPSGGGWPASLPNHVDVSWVGPFWTPLPHEGANARPKLRLDLASPARDEWLPTRVLELETDQLGWVDLDVGPEFAGRAFQLGVSANFEDAPAHWLGTAAPDATRTQIELGPLELQERFTLDPSVDDAQLALVSELAFWTFLRTRRGSGFLLYDWPFECARRGGARWLEFLEERERELLSNLPDPVAESQWLALQTCLCRVRGEPPPLGVLVHPEDIGTRPLASTFPIRFELENRHPSKAFELHQERMIVSVVASNSAGQLLPRKTFTAVPANGLVPFVRLGPGQSTSELDPEGWWSVDAAEEFDLKAGDWTFRVSYSPFEPYVRSNPGTGPKAFLSEPFVVRIRKEQ
jgi:hypothetical protein